jgi:hypothetical protein
MITLIIFNLIKLHENRFFVSPSPCVNFITELIVLMFCADNFSNCFFWPFFLLNTFLDWVKDL